VIIRISSSKATVHAPACKSCAKELDTILAEGTLQASFRPIADFDRCEILGYLASVRGPAGMLHGSYGRLASTSRKLGRLHEFTLAALGTIGRRLIESQVGGLIFVPVPEGAIEAGGQPLAEAIGRLVTSEVTIAERLVLLLSGIDSTSADLAVGWIKHIRSYGVQIAARSFGCDLADEQIWSHGLPDFVFLDEAMFECIDLASISSTELTAKLAEVTGAGPVAVADGIRTSNEFNALKHLGIKHGAGDFFGGSSLTPAHALSAAAHKAIAAASGRNTKDPRTPGGVLERLLVHPPTVTPATNAEEVFHLFERTPQLRALAVVEGSSPRGLISRYDMIDNMARPYRHELFGRKPCARFMDPKPLVIDFGVSLQELSQIVVGADPRHIVSGFIVTSHGDYLGMGSVQDLVREITSMQLEAAKYANPLTQLPGNVAINEHIDKLLADGEPCCIAYCDLDHFKPFNDVYGYAKGDEVILLTARVLSEFCDAERDFLGHIGGDDFVIIFRSDDWVERCKRALERFGAGILEFFNPDDIGRGGYVTENRKGAMEFHKLTSLSIGGVEATPGVFENHLQISVIAAEVKKRAKSIPGNSLYINKRTYPPDLAAE